MNLHNRFLRTSVLTSAIFIFLILTPFISEANVSDIHLPDREYAGDYEKTIMGKMLNRTLYEVLASNGVSPAQILHLSKAFKNTFDFRNCRYRHKYYLYLNADNSIGKFIYKTGILDEYVAERKKDGTYDVYKKKITLNRAVAVNEFLINTSLFKAVADSGESPGIVDALVDIFAWDIDFYLYPQKGDTISVLYEKCTLNGRFVCHGKILAAIYKGKTKSFSAFLFKDGKFENYYDENGQPLKKMFLRTPLKFGKMTSSYSIRRFHPVTKKYKRHTGIDYGAKTGTSILATANGMVKFAGWKSGYGKLVILRHPNGYNTYYGHCSRFDVKKGHLIEQGQVIARVGQTGVATGPHVHYEVRVNGKPINPNKVKKSRGKPLTPELVAQFKKTVQSRLLLVQSKLNENQSARLSLPDKKSTLTLARQNR